MSKNLSNKLCQCELCQMNRQIRPILQYLRDTNIDKYNELSILYNNIFVAYSDMMCDLWYTKEKLDKYKDKYGVI